MDKLVSRNEIFKDDVKKVNQLINQNSDIFCFEPYVDSSLDELIKLDKVFYTDLKKELLSEYENSKYHLDHDIVLETTNYEIINSIEENIAYLRKLEEKDLSTLDTEKIKVDFNEKKFYQNDLLNLYLKLIEINNKYVRDFRTSEAYKKLHTNEEVSRVMAKNFLDPKKSQQIQNVINAAESKNELIKKISQKQSFVMHKLEENKKRFKIKTKKFVFVFVFFAMLSVIAIMLVIFL